MNEPATAGCFVCQAEAPREPERPWEWRSPRVLCRAHDAVLRLPDGQPLSEALARVSPAGGRLEGNLLAWVFNPVRVEIAGRPPVRAFTDFAGGGMGVLEDRFGAGSYFEFSALNLPCAVDALHALYLAATTGGGPVLAEGGQRQNMAFIFSMLQRAASYGADLRRRVNDGLSDLLVRWNSQARLDGLRAAAGRSWPETYDELREWLLACAALMEPDARALPGRTFFPSLFALAERRFAPPIARLRPGPTAP
jgi:hypothetical protein